MYRYTVMAVSTALVFMVFYILLDLIFSRPLDWAQIIFEGVAFGIGMTLIQYIKERNKH